MLYRRAAIIPRANRVSKGPPLRRVERKNRGMNKTKRMIVVTILRRLPVLNRFHSLLISTRNSWSVRTGRSRIFLSSLNSLHLFLDLVKLIRPVHHW